MTSGNHYLGTIRVNKKGLPDEVKFPKTGKNKKVRGTMQQMQKDIHVDDEFIGTAYFTA